MTRCLFAGLVAVCLLGTTTAAQTLFTMDGVAGTVLHQQSSPSGGACNAPNPSGAPAWPYVGIPTCPPGPNPVPIAGPPGGLLGDVAVDSVNNFVYVTDGVTIVEAQAERPCPSLDGRIVNAYSVPAIPTPSGGTMAALSGLGYDGTAGVMWVTDGVYIAGLTGFGAPTGTCPAPTIVHAAFRSGVTAAGFLTDVSWDPFTGSLWACDNIGKIHHILVGGGPAGPSITVSPGPCGLGSVLQGIAYDRATPGLTVPFRAVYVTDGFNIVYIDTSTGLPATPGSSPFYTPNACGIATQATNGLAYSSSAINYGSPRVDMTIRSFGQSTSPGPSFGFEVDGTPTGTVIWLVANFLPGGGPECPPLAAAGTDVWVNPFPPAILMPLVSVGGQCNPIPTPIPGGVPGGITVLVQLAAIDLSDPFGTALDATEGMAFTIAVP